MMSEKKYHCPRCGNEEIADYTDSFDCPSCNLEFDKKDCDELEESQILSVEEKLGIIKGLGLDINKETNSSNYSRDI
ncbi:MAG: hypothetical protein EU529_14765 [Promethearchaeota archaeon]|nr:MAG: hypothetical protein EU529_14765 [Candidatus Lokiarchaeota archaeon]